MYCHFFFKKSLNCFKRVCNYLLNNLLLIIIYIFKLECPYGKKLEAPTQKNS